MNRLLYLSIEYLSCGSILLLRPEADSTLESVSVYENILGCLSVVDSYRTLMLFEHLYLILQEEQPVPANRKSSAPFSLLVPITDNSYFRIMTKQKHGAKNS
jgi:hypothetical protein